MDSPTRAQIRERSRLLRGRYPEAPESPATSDDLTFAIEDAAAVVSAITGRDIGTGVGEEVPAQLVSTALRAVALKAEQLDSSSAPEQAEESSSGRRLRAQNAGPWGEQYFAPGELIVRGGLPQLDPDPRLAELLWLLCTEAKRDEYMGLISGEHPAAGAVTAFDYRRRPGGYG